MHDTGKLAIPEHILNKPGQLTGVRIRNDEAHANIGADILSPSSSRFRSCPSCDIIMRAGMETAIRTGSAGSRIPLGARILAVVDCFDALTSDRPYRRALPRNRALDVILAQRGRMYDPNVVDALMSVQDDIVAEELATERDAHFGLPDAGNHANQAVKVISPSEPASAIAALQMAGRLGGIMGATATRSGSARRCTNSSRPPRPDSRWWCRLDAKLDALRVRAASGFTGARSTAWRSRLEPAFAGWVASSPPPISSAALQSLENTTASPVIPVHGSCQHPLTSNSFLPPPHARAHAARDANQTTPPPSPLLWPRPHLHHRSEDLNIPPALATAAVGKHVSPAARRLVGTSSTTTACRRLTTTTSTHTHLQQSPQHEQSTLSSTRRHLLNLPQSSSSPWCQLVSVVVSSPVFNRSVNSSSVAFQSDQGCGAIRWI